MTPLQNQQENTKTPTNDMITTRPAKEQTMPDTQTQILRTTHKPTRSMGDRYKFYHNYCPERRIRIKYA